MLSVEAFDSVLEAQTVIDDWRNIYNHKRPHSSLGWKPPAAYAASLDDQTGQQPNSHNGWTDKRGPVRPSCLMLRLGPEGAKSALRKPHVRPMDFTGRPMTGMVFVEKAGLHGASLRRWLTAATTFARTLPPKR